MALWAKESLKSSRLQRIGAQSVTNFHLRLLPLVVVLREYFMVRTVCEYFEFGQALASFKTSFAHREL